MSETTTDKSDVVTSQHIASLRGAIALPDKFIKRIETMAGQHIAFFEKSLTDLDEMKKALEKRVDKLADQVGQLPRSDSSFSSVITDIKAYNKKAEADADKKEGIKYFLGNKELSGQPALESAVKKELPQTAKGYASQALNDVVAKDNVKDAGRAGPGVKHASAGKKNVKGNSCSLFFTRAEEDLGLTTVITIVGIGSHAGASTYDIHWAASAGTSLRAGDVFTL